MTQTESNKEIPKIADKHDAEYSKTACFGFYLFVVHELLIYVGHPISSVNGLISRKPLLKSEL